MAATTSTPHRKLCLIAYDIYKAWPMMPPAARAYAEPMLQLTHINEKYGADTALSVVLYFLSNAGTWKGEDARRIKAELRAIVKSTGYKL